MKAHTDLNQSRTLAEFLSYTTADQTWERVAIAGANLDVPEELQYRHNGDMPFKIYSGIGLPCWSLAALFEQIPSDIKTKDDCNYTLEIEKCDAEHLPCGLNYHDSWGRGEDIITHYYDNFVDACVDMIVKLNKKGLL